MKRSGNLYQQVVDELGRAIAVGELAEGTVLPIEADLARNLGVSRTVAREALKSLAARGMVRARPKAGTRVEPRERWSALDPDVIRWRLQGEDRVGYLKSLLELRILVEPSAARLAAERAEKERRQAIWQAFEALAAARNDPVSWIDAAAEMQELILDGCGNEVIAGLGRLLRSAVLESRHFTRPALDAVPRELAAPYASPVDEALARYEAVARAIRDQEPAHAETEMRSLLERVGQLLEHLSRT